MRKLLPNLNDTFIEANFCIQPHDKGLFVCELAHGIAKQGRKTPLMVRNTFHFHIVLSGEALFDGESVKRGDVFLMDNLSPHRLEIISEEDFEQYWFEFYGSDVKRLLSRTAFASDRILYNRDMSKYLPLLFDALNDELPDELLSMKLVGLLLAMLSELESGNILARKTSRTVEYVRRATEYLHYNICEPSPISSAARSVGVTEKYLCRLFKSELELTPIEYLTRLRTETAASLLRSTDLGIAEIAAEVGCADRNYFSRFFKKQQGVTPSEYRSNHRKYR